MRVAAVALVLIVGAVVVLVFANTLNSWVLGGLLGGLAALLLSIPISLALFTLLARRHNALLHPLHRSFEDEPEFAEDFYYDEPVVYEAEGTYGGDDLPVDLQARYLLEERHAPLRLPAAGHSSYEDDQEAAVRHEPRNYPRQPRTQTSMQTSHLPQRPARGETGYQYSTHALSQHQSEALRVARQEAQSQRSGSGSLSRHTQEIRTQALQRTRASRQLRARRSFEERETWISEPEEKQSAWYEEEDGSSDQFTHAPRPASYPRQPRSGQRRTTEVWRTLRDDEDELDDLPNRRVQKPDERMSGSLRNPLVRRAPYLYDDDPLREELTQQLENTHPIDRRPSRYRRHEYDED